LHRAVREVMAIKRDKSTQVQSYLLLRYGLLVSHYYIKIFIQHVILIVIIVDR